MIWLSWLQSAELSMGATARHQGWARAWPHGSESCSRMFVDSKAATRRVHVHIGEGHLIRVGFGAAARVPGREVWAVVWRDSALNAWTPHGMCGASPNAHESLQLYNIVPPQTRPAVTVAGCETVKAHPATVVPLLPAESGSPKQQATPHCRVPAEHSAAPGLWCLLASSRPWCRAPSPWWSCCQC
jgi:hypothetical protein